MIEIVMDKDRNLKNVKQIGTPREEDKIYVENSVYVKMKEESYREKRVFVFMGHTEKMEGRYATFVEAVIPVKNVEFSGNVPRWNNGIWSEVFREIKRIYEDKIIVGWAVDIKGMPPRMTPELERVHREHFGGVHQLLFLMDSMEQDEVFYMYKENKLVSKDGFYIYYRAHKNEKKKMEQPSINMIKENEVGVDLEVKEIENYRGGRYRKIIQEQKHVNTSEGGNAGIAIAVAMLIFVVGVGWIENRESIFGGEQKPAVESVGGVVTEESPSQKDYEKTSVDLESTQASAEDETIPVEVISGTEE